MPNDLDVAVLSSSQQWRRTVQGLGGWFAGTSAITSAGVKSAADIDWRSVFPDQQLYHLKDKERKREKRENERKGE